MNEARDRLRQQITGLTGLHNIRPTSISAF